MYMSLGSVSLTTARHGETTARPGDTEGSADDAKRQQADYFVVNGLELPNTFANRALWARHAFINHPEASGVCDEGLVWMRYRDGYWYSVAGNYSSFSPREKIQKKAERDAEYIRNVETAEEIYKDVMYQSRIRKLVLERDCYTCQLCGKVAKSKLCVHHILKRRQGGTDHIDNLITVCSSCHGKADTSLYDPPWADKEK